MFDSQSSRRDIREQRFRLFKLNTSVARRVAIALQDSELSTSAQYKKEKPIAETVNFKFLWYTSKCCRHFSYARF